MRVAIDVRVLSLQDQWTGVAQYIVGLAKGYRQSPGSSVEVRGISFERAKASRSGLAIDVFPQRFRLPWQSLVLPLTLSPSQYQIFHGPAFSVPRVLRVPRVVTIHDLTFVRFPETVVEETARYLNRMVPGSIEAAARVVVPSSEVREDLLAWRPRMDPAKVAVIPLGADRLPAPANPTAPLAEPYVLHVGTLEPRKNLALLLKGYQEAMAQAKLPHRLVLIGASGWKNSDLAEPILSLGDRLVMPGYLDDHELARYYAHAALYVSTARYEGFGLGVVEALYWGTPVVATATGVARDLSGPGIWVLNAPHVDLLAHAMLQALAGPRPPVGGEGLTTWKETYRKHAALWQEVVG